MSCVSSTRDGGRFEIFDDMRLDAGIADEPEHVARRPAGGVVVDHDIYDGRHATFGRAEVAPSVRPISRSFVPSAILSRLFSGSAVNMEMRFLR